MRPLAALLACLALGGCVSIVTVRAEGAPPRLSVWSPGVKIETRGPTSVRTDMGVFGAFYDCGAVGLGVGFAGCTVEPLEGGAWRKLP